MARKATGPELGVSIEGTGVAHHMEGALREGNLNTVGPELRIDGRSDAALDGHAVPRILVPPHHAEVERGEPLSTAECTAEQGQDEPGQNTTPTTSTRSRTVKAWCPMWKEVVSRSFTDQRTTPYTGSPTHQISLQLIESQGSCWKHR